MSMIFKFRMLSDESDVFVRDYEVKYDMNLLEFNDFIFKKAGEHTGRVAAATDTCSNDIRKMSGHFQELFPGFDTDAHLEITYHQRERMGTEN